MLRPEAPGSKSTETFSNRIVRKVVPPATILALGGAGSLIVGNEFINWVNIGKDALGVGGLAVGAALAVGGASFALLKGWDWLTK